MEEESVLLRTTSMVETTPAEAHRQVHVLTWRWTDESEFFSGRASREVAATGGVDCRRAAGSGASLVYSSQNPITVVEVHLAIPQSQSLVVFGSLLAASYRIVHDLHSGGDLSVKEKRR
jgi:hypothetical protein